MKEFLFVAAMMIVGFAVSKILILGVEQLPTWAQYTFAAALAVGVCWLISQRP